MDAGGARRRPAVIGSWCGGLSAPMGSIGTPVGPCMGPVQGPKSVWPMTEYLLTQPTRYGAVLTGTSAISTMNIVDVAPAPRLIDRTRSISHVACALRRCGLVVRPAPDRHEDTASAKFDSTIAQLDVWNASRARGRGGQAYLKNSTSRARRAGRLVCNEQTPAGSLGWGNGTMAWALRYLPSERVYTAHCNGARTLVGLGARQYLRLFAELQRCERGSAPTLHCARLLRACASVGLRRPWCDAGSSLVRCLPPGGE